MARKTGLTFNPGCLVDPSPDQVIQLLSNAIPQADRDALDLIHQMIQWNPDSRPTAAECLKHRFLKSSKGSPEADLGSGNKAKFEPFKELTVRKLAKME